MFVCVRAHKALIFGRNSILKPSMLSYYIISYYIAKDYEYVGRSELDNTNLCEGLSATIS